MKHKARSHIYLPRLLHVLLQPVFSFVNIQGMHAAFVLLRFFFPNLSLSSARSCIQEEYKIGPQLQEQILQPVDAEPAESEPVDGLCANSDLGLEDNGLAWHHGN